MALRIKGLAVWVEWSDEDQVYVATGSGRLRGMATHGHTAAQAAREFLELMDDLLEDLDSEDPVPSWAEEVR